MKPVFSDRDETTISKKYVDIDKPASIALDDVVTRQQAEEMANQAAIRAAEIATEKAFSKKKEKKEREDDDDTGSVISSKTVKELQNIASVFNALKEFSANPLQKAIEGKVGDVAAGVVERAFTPHQEPQKKDFMDQILNSQFAAGLGAGLGQRGPEIVNTLTSNFGKEKVDGWITGAINPRDPRSGGGTGIGGILGAMPPIGGMGGMGGKSKQLSEMEMVLSLDLNNPEHVAAYAHSQGDMSIDVARKVLSIHQDDFIKQLELQGVDTSQYRLRKNQNQSQDQSQNQYQDVKDVKDINQERGYVPNPGNENVQEYRSPSRISDDLIVNTPATEDNKWEKESDNIELHPEMERVGQERVEKGSVKPVAEGSVKPVAEDNRPSVTDNPGEIVTYLKSLNDYVIGLKEAVENQNNEMFNLRQEIDVLKRDRTIPDDIIKDRDNQTTVRSMKTIKKGYSYHLPNDVK